MDMKKVIEETYKNIEEKIDKFKNKDLLKPGYCPKCGVEMATFNKVTKLPLTAKDNYIDYWVELTNDTKMRIGICKDCIDSIDDEFIKEYMRKERNTQVYQLHNNPNMGKEKKYRGIMLVGTYEVKNHGKQEPILKKEKNGNKNSKT